MHWHEIKHIKLLKGNKKKQKNSYLRQAHIFNENTLLPPKEKEKKKKKPTTRYTLTEGNFIHFSEGRNNPLLVVCRFSINCC